MTLALTLISRLFKNYSLQQLNKQPFMNFSRVILTASIFVIFDHKQFVCLEHFNKIVLKIQTIILENIGYWLQ